jgi:hypothetical protein
VIGGLPLTLTASVANTFSVTAEDASGNVATGYLGTVHFTSSDPQVALPADYTFLATDAGRHTFSVTLNTAGTQSLNATDTNSANITGTQSRIKVTPISVPANLVQAANIFTHSAEYYTDFITAAYQRYLGRSPDPQGLASWLAAMQHGLSDEKLEAGFIGSGEYIANHGGTGQAWIAGMYHDLLGRAPDAQGLAAWLSALAHGVSPSLIAYGFAASGEREGQRITGDYETYLGRAPESQAIVNDWVNAFLTGTSNESVIAGFVGSGEYFKNASKGDGRVDAWITSAYQDLLNRQPSATEITDWARFLGHA